MNNLITIEGVKRTIFGSGAVNQIGLECKKLGASRALLVMDKFLAKTDTCLRIQDLVRKSRVKLLIYSDVTPEPDPIIADIGSELAKKEKVRCVIGVGGGSTMDVAKAISVLSKNDGKAVDYIGLNKVQKAGLPSIMVPTTAGTGSETTFTSVFTMRDTKSKGGINSPFLYPHTAILDPELTLDLPPYVTAYTGMDALTHAIESFTSVQAHFMSELVSLRAVELISDNLRGSVFNGSNITYRENMMIGSYLAGLGLAMSGVGAVHALAYPLGALFDVPHGIANSLLLPYVLEYNYPGDIDKFCHLSMLMDQEVEGLSSRDMASMVSEAVYDLAGDIGVPRTLKELDIPEDSIPEMAKAAMKVEIPIKNNPRPMTAEAAEEIYRQAFGE
ncbi:iron-containing alcohol dehydrogenase [Thermodesulfobacteriota bacterium]